MYIEYIQQKWLTKTKATMSASVSVYVAEIDLRRFRMPGIIRIIIICLEAYKINTLMVFKDWQFFDQNKCELERSGRMVTQANHIKNTPPQMIQLTIVRKSHEMLATIWASNMKRNISNESQTSV